MTTSADWILEQVNVDFQLQLDLAVPANERGRADDEALAFIRERMKLCPVSRNLPATVHKAISLKMLSPDSTAMTEVWAQK